MTLLDRRDSRSVDDRKIASFGEFCRFFGDARIHKSDTFPRRYTSLFSYARPIRLSRDCQHLLRNLKIPPCQTFSSGFPANNFSSVHSTNVLPERPDTYLRLHISNFHVHNMSVHQHRKRLVKFVRFDIRLPFT